MPPGKLLLMVLAVEGLLLALAWLLGWFGFYDPQKLWVNFSEASWLIDGLVGAVLAVPLLIFMLWWVRLPNGFSRSMLRIVDDLLRPLFSGLKLWQIALISIAAGIGEEIFFRGCLQVGLSIWVPVPLALCIASAVFGICHWVNFPYAVMAGFIGLVLGLQWILTQSIVMPVVCHAVYDFLAIVSLSRSSESVFSLLRKGPSVAS